MAVTITPGFNWQNGNTVMPSRLNASQTDLVINQATGKLLGRTTAGAGAVEEIAPGAGVDLSSGGVSVGWLDTNSTHRMRIACGSDLTADRTITITPGDAARSITLNGDVTLNDWFNQSVKTTASPAFAGLTVNTYAFTVNGAPTLNDWFNQSVKSTASPTFVTVTANVTGNVSGSSGSCTGNAATATALQTARAINGVNFDGTAAITVTAAAGTLTGTTLNAAVVTSSLTTVGALNSGSITSGFGSIDIGSDSLTAGAATVATLVATAGITSRVNLTIGTGGALNVSDGLLVDSSSAASYGAFISLRSAGVEKGVVALKKVLLGGTSNDLALYSNSDNVVVYASGTLSSTFLATGMETKHLAISGTAGQISTVNSSNVNGPYVTYLVSGSPVGDVGSATQVFGSGTAADFGVSSRSATLYLGTGNSVRMTVTSGALTSLVPDIVIDSTSSAYLKLDRATSTDYSGIQWKTAGTTTGGWEFYGSNAVNQVINLYSYQASAAIQSWTATGTSFTGTATASGKIASTVASGSFGLQVESGARVALDGGSNTYIVESAADTIDLVTGGSSRLTVSSTQVTLSSLGAGFVRSNSSGVLSTVADPNADRLIFWDDSAGSVEYLTLGTNLSITGTTINAAGGGAGIGGSTGVTDNRIIRADGTGGATVQSSAVTIDDSGNISGVGTLAIGGALSGVTTLAMSSTLSGGTTCDFSTEYRVNGTKVLGAQAAAEADIALTTGGFSSDAATHGSNYGTLNGKINSILGKLRTHGIIAT